MEQCVQRGVSRIVSLGQHDRHGPCLFPDNQEAAYVFVVKQNKSSDSARSIREIR